MILPPNQADWAWPKLVHQDAEWKCCGAQQEGADGETQIQHLFLVHAAEPLVQLVAGGRVAQGHDHGIVLCGGRSEGTVPGAETFRLWSLLGTSLAQYSVSCPLLPGICIPTVNFPPPPP